MDLDRYLHALRYYWYIAAVLIIAGVLGTWIYIRFNRGRTATATVAVLEPSVTNAQQGQQAQVNFASVAESLRVAERVIDRLDLSMDGEDLRRDVSVELSRTLVPSFTSPLYTVEYKHPDSALALLVTDTLIEEARQVFQEVNAPDSDYVASIMEPEEEHLRTEFRRAVNDLSDFEQEHQAWILPAQIEAQIDVIKSYRLAGGGLSNSAPVREELERDLAQAEAELDSLYSLLPEYERLSIDASLAVDRMLLLSDADTLRDFQLSPSRVDSEIEETIENWLQARQALFTYLDESGEEVPEAEPADESPDFQDAYDHWTMARLSMMETVNNRYFDGQSDTSGRSPHSDVQAGLLSERGLVDLPERLDTQQDLVQTMRIMLLNARIDNLGYQAALNAEEARLQRLLELLPEYQVRATRVNQLQTALGMLAAREAELIFQGSLPLSAQVKVLDPAHFEPNLLDTLIPLGLSLSFTLSVAIITIYLLAYFVHIPFSGKEVEAWLDTPVLTSVPNAYKRRRLIR